MLRSIPGITIFAIAFAVGFFAVPRISNNPVTMPIPSVELVSTSIEPSIPLSTDGIETIDKVEYSWSDESQLTADMSLLEVGHGFHGDEVSAKNGEEWLGLFQNGVHYSVKPVKLRIERVHDEVVDGKEEQTGKSVDVPGSNKPLFLLKGGRSIRSGKTPSFYRGMTDADYAELANRGIFPYNGGFTRLDKDYQDTFVAADKQEYKLKVLKAKDKEGNRILALSLENRGIRQILYTSRTWEETNHESEWSGELGILYWVGDIDRDGKPDFYMELYVHDNVVWKTLFLSSAAGEGEHVKLAADFWITGC